MIGLLMNVVFFLWSCCFNLKKEQTYICTPFQKVVKCMGVVQTLRGQDNGVGGPNAISCVRSG